MNKHPDQIGYRGERIAAGVELSLSKNVKVGLSVGEAFGRRFRFFGNRTDYDLARAPFAGVALKFFM